MRCVGAAEAHDQEKKGRGGCAWARDTAAVRWRPAGAQWPWHAQRRTAREGSRPGEGEGRRVESARAGGGAGEELERRWAVRTAGSRGEAEEQSRGARGKRRGEGSEGLVCKNRKSRDLTVK
jgi:hypothetical protein